MPLKFISTCIKTFVSLIAYISLPIASGFNRETRVLWLASQLLKNATQSYPSGSENKNMCYDVDPIKIVLTEEGQPLKNPSSFTILTAELRPSSLPVQSAFHIWRRGIRLYCFNIKINWYREQTNYKFTT